ncbi:MAG: ATP-binding protein [Gemmatimonadetes bacterium]|nr:ATP-binding protein [Gemmatimonadota bacterium]
MTFDAFDVRGNRASPRQRGSLRDALDAARSFARRPDGWLLLTGPTGVGKTHLAVAIAACRAEQGAQAVFAFLPDLLDHLRAAYAPGSRISYDRLFESVRNAELLILDDMAPRGTTAWVDEKLYQLIVHRFNLRLPTVITTRATTSSLSRPDEAEQHDAPYGADARGHAPTRRGDEERFPEEIESRLSDAHVVTERFMSAPDYRIRGTAASEPRRPRAGRPRR